MGLIMLIDENKTLVCSCCGKAFSPIDGKHLIKDDQIICPTCVENYENTESEPGSLLLG
jgi:DNA-directed RNA polymerase subunit RPC12/RpoP